MQYGKRDRNTIHMSKCISIRTLQRDARDGRMLQLNMAFLSDVLLGTKDSNMLINTTN